MIVFYGLIAIFIAWIWIDYYRLIDIYEKEKLIYFIITFLLGCASVLIVFGINYYFLDALEFDLNGEFSNDFFLSVFKIGAVEEFAKLVPFLIVYYLFKDQFNEPIDYLAYICTAALGFSAIENVMYFDKYGPYIINGRAILSTVGHMFDTALIAYGIILVKYKFNKSKFFYFILFFLLASLSHGFYDFWLLYEKTRFFGWIITIFYFLISISIFSVILNNALNNSSFFSYKKVIDPDKLTKRLLSYYGIVFLIQFIILIIIEDIQYAIYNFSKSIFLTGFIVFVTVVRLSRFKLIQNRWHKIKIELPFSIFQGDLYGLSTPFLSLKIKGDSFNEIYINAFFEEFFYLNPLNSSKTYLGYKRLAFIEKKLFLIGDQSFYLAKVFYDNESGPFENYLLKPKKNGVTNSAGKYPIVAVLNIKHLPNIEAPGIKGKDLRFMEWGVIKPKLHI